MSKLFFIHCLDIQNKKWKKVYRMCLTYAEASYTMELLQRNDKFSGKYNVYRIVCITTKTTSIKQLELF